MAQRLVKGGDLYTTLGAVVNEADYLEYDPINAARGISPRCEPFGAFGERTTSGAETNYQVWPNGLLELLPDAGAQLSFVSTSAEDSPTGNGVQSIHMHYLDGSLNDQDEIVILNGLTPVLTTATDIRFVQCLHIDESVSTSVAGTITASYSGVIYSEILAGQTRCSSSFRRVPRNKRLMIYGAIGSSISGTAAARTQLRIVANSIATHQYTNPLIFVPHGSVGVQDGNAALEFKPPLAFYEGDIVGITHTSDKGCTISASWFGTLEDIV